MSIVQVARSREGDASTDRLSAIDYFGKGQTNGAQITSGRHQEEDEDDEGQHEKGCERADSNGRGKRKQQGVEKDGRKKTKKSKSNQAEVEGNGCGCLLPFLMI